MANVKYYDNRYYDNRSDKRGRNFILKKDSNEIICLDKSIPEVYRLLTDEKTSNELKNTICGIHVDFTGIHDMYIMIDSEHFLKKYESIPEDLSFYICKYEEDIELNYPYCIKEAPLDYCIGLKEDYLSNLLLLIAIFSYKNIINGVNQFLKNNSSPYQYLYAINKSPNGVNKTQEEFKKSVCEVFDSDDVIEIEDFNFPINYKYIYLMRNKVYYPSNQIILKNTYREVLVYLPMFKMYQKMSKKDFKKLNSIQQLDLTCCVTDDPICYSTIQESIKYEENDLIDIITAINAFSIDFHLMNYLLDRRIFNKIKEGDLLSGYKNLYRGLRLDIHFLNYKLNIFLTEYDIFNHGYLSRHKPSKELQWDINHFHGNNFQSIIYFGGNIDNFWLLKFIIKAAKLRLEDISYERLYER